MPGTRLLNTKKHLLILAVPDIYFFPACNSRTPLKGKYSYLIKAASSPIISMCTQVETAPVTIKNDEYSSIIMATVNNDVKTAKIAFLFLISNGLFFLKVGM